MTERKKEIVTMASSLFRKKGYTAVSMRVLANEVGIKAASLYNHISSKQEILSIIVLGLAERFTQRMEVIKTKEVSAIEKIKQVILLHIEITLDDSTGLESLQNNWMYLEGESLNRYRKLRNEYEESLRNIIKDGIAAGHIKNVNTEILIFSLLSTLRSLYVWYPRQKDIAPERLKEEIISVLMQGMEHT